MAKQIRISFRTTKEFKERAQAAAKKVNLDETVIEAAAIEAVIKHIEEYGEITIPVRLALPRDPGGKLNKPAGGDADTPSTDTGARSRGSKKSAAG